MAAVGSDLVRSAEWRRVRDFAREVRPSPAALVIQGEAGAGKSTLWRAGIQAAAAAGHRLLRSEPSSSETDLSFAGLSDLLADVLPRVAAQIPVPQREALEIALLLRPGGAEPPTARAVGLAVLAALSACVSDAPVVVAVDDAQWLDEASRDALAFALRRVPGGPLSLLVAARAEAAADPLTAGGPPPSRDWHALLAALPAAEMIDLAPLDMWQIQNLLPRTVTAAQARVVARQSRGNPFWALQVSASLDSAEDPVPPLARTLTSRLSRSLSPEAAQALAVVAAAGRIGVPEALAVLKDLEDPAAALDAAVVAGVVVEAGDRLSAAHPLIGAAAVESLPPGRRTRLYRRLAYASSNPERHAHFTALAAGTGPDPAVAEALDAAAAAAHARAGNAAAAQFATQSVLFTPESDEDGLVRRRIRAAELLYLAGDMEQSLAHLKVLDIDRLATAGLERALPLLLDLTDLMLNTAAATAMVTRAVSRRGDRPTPARAGAGSRLRRDLWHPRRQARCRHRGDQLRGGGGRAGQRRASSCARQPVHREGDAAEGLDSGLLDRAARLEASLPPGRLHDSADIHRAWSRYTEDLDTARAALQRSISRARDIGDDFALATFCASWRPPKCWPATMPPPRPRWRRPMRRPPGMTGRCIPGVSSRAASC